jgi:hypothetical protein
LNYPAYQKKGEEIKPIGERAMSDSQSSSEFRNDIPAVYPQSCDLPGCPCCGGKVGVYLCTNGNSSPRWCYSYAFPKIRYCRFCNEEFFPHLYASPDDAAAGWRAKVMGYHEKGMGIVLRYILAIFIVLGLIGAFSFFIESLNCGCFK